MQTSAFRIIELSTKYIDPFDHKNLPRHRKFFYVSEYRDGERTEKKTAREAETEVIVISRYKYIEPICGNASARASSCGI
jgi:hypothetical protein